MQTLVEKFNDIFGEAIEVIKRKYVVAISAPRIEALVHLPTMFARHKSNLTHYNVVELPKEESRKNQIVTFGTRSFNYKRVKKIVEGFFNSFVDAGVCVIDNLNLLLFKINEEHGIILAEREENLDDRFLMKLIDDKIIENTYNIYYDWDGLFTHQNFGDDMEL